MKDFSKSIVEKIKKAHIVPESRLRLQWKSYVFWFIMLCLIISGALSLSMVILNLVDVGPDFLRYLGLQKFIRVIFITAPYLWIGLSLTALFFGVLAFRKTAKGYRRSTLFVTSLVVLLISMLGMFSHILKIDTHMGGILFDRAPNFNAFIDPRDDRWQRPKDGLLGGEIISTEMGSFTLRGFDNQEWKVLYDEKTERRDGVDFVPGEKVGIIGAPAGKFMLQAFSVKKFPADWNGQPPVGPMPPEQDNRPMDQSPLPPPL